MTLITTSAVEPDEERDGPEFFVGIGLEIGAIIDAYRQLSDKMRDLHGSHNMKQPVSLKLAADDIAKLAGQIQIMSSHISTVTTKYVNRRPRP